MCVAIKWTSICGLHTRLLRLTMRTYEMSKEFYAVDPVCLYLSKTKAKSQ